MSFLANTAIKRVSGKGGKGGKDGKDNKGYNKGGKGGKGGYNNQGWGDSYGDSSYNSGKGWGGKSYTNNFGGGKTSGGKNSGKNSPPAANPSNGRLPAQDALGRDIPDSVSVDSWSPKSGWTSPKGKSKPEVVIGPIRR
jgi:hypothetical protein